MLPRGLELINLNIEDGGKKPLNSAHIRACPHTSKLTEAEPGLSGVQSSSLFFRVWWKLEKGGNTCCVDLPLEGGGGTRLTSNFGAS